MGRNEEGRVKGATELKEYVTSVARELTGEPFIKFMNDVNRRIFDLTHSSETNEKIGGIMAIDKLIDFEGEDNTTKMTRFANYLHYVLPGNDTQVMILAAKALGRLAIPGGTRTAEFVEYEIKRSLEWLQGDRIEARRHAAVLVIGELAINAPTLVYTYIPQIFESIWIALRDPKVIIRESASEALTACLTLIFQRDSNLRIQWYRKMVDESYKGFKIGSVETIHGSLLTFREMFRHTGKATLLFYP